MEYEHVLTQRYPHRLVDYPMTTNGFLQLKLMAKDFATNQDDFK